MSKPSRIPLRARVAAAAAAALLLAGCGGEPKAQVSGTVTLDGVQVENGVIQFYPAGGAGQTAGTGITNGKYSTEASPGEMTVTINAAKVVGKQKLYDTPDSPVEDKVAELIPEKYNALSTLKVTLQPGVNENVNFELKTK